MSIADLPITTFSGTERTLVKEMHVPPEVIKWADGNQELILKIQNALASIHENFLTEDTLWEIIAEASSDEWKAARKKLDDAEREWMNLNYPENVSLGLIGRAMDSDRNNPVKEELDLSLTAFSLINEGLHQREDLSRLLQALLVQKRMLERSLQQTADMLKKSTVALAFELNAKKKTSRTPRQKSIISKLFKKHAAAKNKPATNVPVPSSPRT